MRFHQRSSLLITLLLFLVLSNSTTAQPGTQAGRTIYLPAIAKTAPAPRPTTSYYILDTTPELLPSFQLLGCAGAVEMQRQGIQPGFVALLFGAPAYSQDKTSAPGGYGTLAPNETYLTVDSINEAVWSWIKGFVGGYSSSRYLCGLRPGQAPARPKVVLAIGVTNEPLMLSPLDSIDIQPAEVVTYTLEGHGAAWAGLINRLRQHVALNGWSDFLSVVAAYDAEVDYHSAAQTKAWLKGYKDNTAYLYYHLGSCEGCPNPSPWSQRDIWDLTAGAGGPVVPQIYRTDGVMARQWSTIADILRRTPDPTGGFPGSTLTPLTFSGVLTQRKACDDRGGDSRPPVSGSTYCNNGLLYNSPEQGWRQLYDTLSQRGLLRSLPWATDIRYNWELDQFLRPATALAPSNGQ